MAFLDNSGDIILDAVLTDAGRKRLARGDGTFKITKYAFGDDEINYDTYDPNAASGSAYFDLEILQTPVLEAFTNNRSSLKSRLISLTNNNLLFLPELVLNEVDEELTGKTPDTALTSGSFLIAVNLQTRNSIEDNGTLADISSAYLHGYGTPKQAGNGRHIRVDQGLNTNKLDGSIKLSAELTEQQYLLSMDNRFGMITDVYGSNIGSPSFIDDDQIATYYVTKNAGGSLYVVDCSPGQLTNDGNINIDYVGAGTDASEVISGPRGTKLRFGIMASDNLQSSDYLFETIGSTKTVNSVDYLVLNSTIKVVGVTTGYHIDVPVTFVKRPASS